MPTKTELEQDIYKVEEYLKSIPSGDIEGKSGDEQLKTAMGLYNLLTVLLAWR
jgi:hypothetical protein